MSADGFSYVALQDRALVPEYLEALAEGLREGTIVLASGDQEFRATPGDLVWVRIESGRAEELVHLTIRLSWSELALSAENAPPLSIGPAQQ